MPRPDSLDAGELLDKRGSVIFFYPMGNAISPRGVMLKNRVPLKCKDAACPSFQTIFGPSSARPGVCGGRLQDRSAPYSVLDASEAACRAMVDQFR
jgi:hypothetical protein